MTAAEQRPLRDELSDVDVLSSEVVYHGRVWDMRSDRFRYNDQTISREYVDHTGAVAILALDDDDRVLLINQYRHPVRARLWEIPAGLLDVSAESPLDAARRELAEEADIDAKSWATLAEFYTSPGGSDEAIRIYLARGLTQRAESFERTAEEADIEVRWVALDDVVAAVLERKLQNPSLVTGVLSAYVERQRDWSGLGAADAEWPRLRSRGAEA